MKEASTRRALGLFLSLAFKADKVRLLWLVVVEIVWRASSIIAVYGLKLMVDAVVASDSSRVLVAALVIAAPLGLQQIGGPAYVRVVYDLTERILLDVETALTKAVSDTVSIEHLETPKYLDEVMLAGRQRGMVASLMRVLITTVQTAVLLVGSLALLASIDPRILFLPLAGVPALLAGRVAAKLTESARERSAESNRRRSHLYRVAVSAPAGKELRIFGILPKLLDSHRSWSDEVIKTTRGAGIRASALRISASLFFAAGYVLAILFILQRVLAGEATPGDVILVLTLASQINGQVGNLAQSGETFAQITKTAKRFVGVLDHPTLTYPRVDRPIDPPEVLSRGISIENLTFRYLDAESEALRGVTIHMQAVSVVALVGENGAGKTTLVKVLSRMYEPASGRILVDGQELARMDPIQWRRRISAAFQDFIRFEFTLGESVGIGDLEFIGDEERIRAALHKAGGPELASVGGLGLATQLGKQWEGGIELSGGQWQKLALARGLMRAAPLLLIFDEPTAALDADTEHRLFESLTSASKSGSSNGMITLLVSHRFSTVRMADLIVVMDKGRILESGSHAELIANDGLYRELYELQARGYR